MAFARGQALLAMDMQREAEREQELWQKEQEKMAARKGRSSWGSIGLGLLGGALLGPAGMMIGQQLGRYGGRALTGRGLKTDFKDMYGVSDKFRKELGKGMFHSARDEAAVSKLASRDTATGDILSSFADAMTMGIAAGGPDAILGKTGGSVGGLKELTTYGASGAGGKAGLLGGWTKDAAGDIVFQTPKTQWQSGQFMGGASGASSAAPTMDDPGMYSRTKGPVGFAEKLGQPYGPTGTAQFKRPAFNTAKLTSPEFSRWRYLMDMGSNVPSQATAPGAGTPGSQSFLQNLYSGVGKNLVPFSNQQSPMGQLMGSQRTADFFSPFLASGDEDFYSYGG